MSKNDITGDTLISKPSTDAYVDGWDKIFGKKKFPEFSEEFNEHMKNKAVVLNSDGSLEIVKYEQVK